MAIRRYRDRQTRLSQSAAYSRDIKNYPETPDILEFKISVLDPTSGAVTETLSLQGTHLPHQPFSNPVRQTVMKYYYPGGQANRVPTMQILGSVDEDVVLRGRFKSTKIQDVNRRNEPLILRNTLERIVRQGNVCLFQLGDFIKYGVLMETRPAYKTDSDIDWEIRISVIGDKNPITGEALQQTTEQAISRIFSSSETEDPTAIADQIADEIDTNRRELEASYLPPVNIPTPFSVKAYLAGLLQKGPVGEIVSVGQTAYNSYLSMMRSVDNVLDIVEQVPDVVENVSFEISKAIQGLESNISRLYGVQEDVFVAYANVSGSLPAFTRLTAFNTYGNLLNLNNNLLLSYKDIEDSFRGRQFSRINMTYIANEKDTYQSLATRFYGSFDRWEEIKNINGYAELQGGEVLLIPT